MKSKRREYLIEQIGKQKELREVLAYKVIMKEMRIRKLESELSRVNNNS